MVTGLFVVPELTARESEPSPPMAGQTRLREVWQGCVEVASHGWLLLRGSTIGALVGMVPGLGASAAVWIAYGHARQTHPSDIPYGEGAIAGVIAPEAANNAKEEAPDPDPVSGDPCLLGHGHSAGGLHHLGRRGGPTDAYQEP
uniref:Tripartite tricarboxylate transporter permease n=1 Tax=Phenylobacterium glaciei TaxID=2803784 RepID=A0A974P5Q6_9CAUL|nr:tripartite tricarboxylate transporter permease [Phenylobacterium glaciei]